MAATTIINLPLQQRKVKEPQAQTGKPSNQRSRQGHLVSGPTVGMSEQQAASAATELYDFILDRLRGYYADKGVPVQHFNAVAELRPASLYDFDRRIDAIGTFARLPEAEALAAANKRIGNILKKAGRSEEHTSELQSLMRISYAVFCLKKTKKKQ